MSASVSAMTTAAGLCSAHSRYLEAHLRDATLLEVEDPNDAWFIGNVAWLVEQVNRFLGVR